MSKVAQAGNHRGKPACAYLARERAFGSANLAPHQCSGCFAARREPDRATATPEQVLAAVQSGATVPTFTPEILREIAGTLGLDLARYDADVATPSAAARVDAEYVEGEKRGVEFVPILFVGDKPYEGPLEVRELSAAIDTALTESLREVDRERSLRH